jgi:hypothetical protein
MRINYFVGIEGTHGLVYKVLEMDPRTDVFETFIGPKARQRMDLPLQDILVWIFGQDKLTSEELNIGITKTGAQGVMLTNLWEKSPAGTRVFFFKSADDAVNLDKHTSFLKVAPNRERIEMLTGMTDELLESRAQGYQEVTTNALTALNQVADHYSASPWDAFDLNSFFGDPANTVTSNMFFRLATKV